MVVATLAAVLDNARYKRLSIAKNGMADPEDRLPPAMVESILIPVGLFWFAWTCDEPIHWIVPVFGSAFFACGVVVVFMSLLNWLIDSCESSFLSRCYHVNMKQTSYSLLLFWWLT